EYDPLKVYAQGNLVTFQGKLFRAKQATQGNAPTGQESDPNWALIGDYTSLGAAVGDLASRMAEVETVEADHALKLVALESASANADSAIAVLQQTTATTADLLTSVKTRVDGAEASIQSLST